MTRGSRKAAARGAIARAAVIVVVAARLRTAGAQTPITRDQAIASALDRGGRIALARADTTVASAGLRAAREWQNPSLSATYSKATPNYHYIAEIPLDVVSRGPRVASARAAREAAQFRFAFERAAVQLDADTTYTRAVASREKSRLSRRNAQEADSLLHIAAARRDAGDASDLDVELATVNAGQAANIAAADSLAYLSTVLDLQAVMGLSSDQVALFPSDSLAPPTLPSGVALPAAATPLQVAAARASLQSANLALSAQRRSVFGTPSLIGGIEQGDPAEPGVLPTFGVAIPFPLFNRNGGAITQARAEQSRALAELSLAETESHIAIARARRQLAITSAKVERDRTLVGSANRVAAMSLTAYREGAASLANVLEAQRNAREVLAQYVDDVADAWIASALLGILTLSAPTNP